MNPVSTTTASTIAGTIGLADGCPAATPSWIDMLTQYVLPSVAIWVGYLAALWVGCAIVTTAGAYTVLFLARGAQRLTRVGLHAIRRHRGIEYAHLVTVTPDGVTTTPVHPDRARRLRPAASAPRTDTTAPSSGEAQL